MNVSDETVKKWLKRGVPLDRVVEWCAITGKDPFVEAPRIFDRENPYFMKLVRKWWVFDE